MRSTLISCELGPGHLLRLTGPKQGDTVHTRQIIHMALGLETEAKT